MNNFGQIFIFYIKCLLLYLARYAKNKQKNKNLKALIMSKVPTFFFIIKVYKLFLKKKKKSPILIFFSERIVKIKNKKPKKNPHNQSWLALDHWLKYEDRNAIYRYTHIKVYTKIYIHKYCVYNFKNCVMVCVCV